MAKGEKKVNDVMPSGGLLVCSVWDSRTTSRFLSLLLLQIRCASSIYSFPPLPGRFFSKRLELKCFQICKVRPLDIASLPIRPTSAEILDYSGPASSYSSVAHLVAPAEFQQQK